MNPLGNVVVLSRHDDVGAAEVLETVGVVMMQMRQHEVLEILGRIDAHTSKLRADLVLRRDVEVDREPEERMPPRKEARRGGLPAVEQDQALVVLDQVGVDRERLGPVPVGDDVQAPTPQRPRHVCPEVRGANPDGAGLDRDDCGHRSPLYLA